MNRKAFLLGCYATGGQVLLLRELVSSLNGDELFIGTALFGWLIWVALGAFLGGRYKENIGFCRLLIPGALLVPVSVVLARLSPVLVTDVVGEMIPFTVAALISIAIMLPVAIVSGWMFSSLSRRGLGARESIVRVYFYEGVGAFVIGLLLAVVVGGFLSTLGTSLLLAILLPGAYGLASRERGYQSIVPILSVYIVAVVAVVWLTPRLDVLLDEIKYRSYRVERSFDTHYGHQAILSRDDSYVLLTDNNVEATCPDIETAENLLLPALAYCPEASRVLLIGRSEFGVARLGQSLPGLSLTSVDPRERLSWEISDVLPGEPAGMLVQEDPVTYLRGPGMGSEFDIVIIAAGEFDSYKTSRLVTAEFLCMVKEHLNPGGILCLPTHYDTDRYITTEARAPLSVLCGGLRDVFRHVTVWPGNTTVFLASSETELDLPVDSVIERLSGLACRPQYVSENYLGDRLSDFKTTRLRDAVRPGTRRNSVAQPWLPYCQAGYRAKTNAADRTLLWFVLGQPAWLLIIPVLVLLFWLTTALGDKRSNRFGLFLYFVAGFVSLSLELISFYVYQSSAGTLYSEMAALIGAFMLGLAVGTYYTYHLARRNFGSHSVLMLLVAAALFLITYDQVHPTLLLYYHALFLFTVAVATGSLFVAATERYYHRGAITNRGAGYAGELIGSSLGALIATTVLLPVLGLPWLLISIMILLGVALLGSLVSGEGF